MSSFLSGAALNETQTIAYNNARHYLAAQNAEGGISTDQLAQGFTNNNTAGNVEWGKHAAALVDQNHNGVVNEAELTAYFQTYFESAYSGVDSGAFNAKLGQDDAALVGQLSLNYQLLTQPPSAAVAEPNAQLEAIGTVALDNAANYVLQNDDGTGGVSKEQFAENLSNNMPDMTANDALNMGPNVKTLASLDGDDRNVSILEVAAFMMAQNLWGVHDADPAKGWNNVVRFANAFTNQESESSVNQLVKDLFTFLLGRATGASGATSAASTESGDSAASSS
ncbi:MAG: hypothetical protein KC474_11155 [Cyanobacteria bacterium HKST-UBA04]|nr:hypothetical protein [Cyanobacteria bacterium HKST-UBA04]